jgi:heme exporter protein A
VRAHTAAGGAAIIATHIDLGLESRVLDVSALRAVPAEDAGFDEAFL